MPNTTKATTHEGQQGGTNFAALCNVKSGEGTPRARGPLRATLAVDSEAHLTLSE